MSRDIRPHPYTPAGPGLAPSDPSSLPPAPFLPAREPDVFPSSSYPYPPSSVDFAARVPSVPIPLHSDAYPALPIRTLPRDLPIPTLSAQPLHPSAPGPSMPHFPPSHPPTSMAQYRDTLSILNASAQEHSFEGLSHNLLYHPFFPLLFHRIFECCGGLGLFRDTSVALLLRGDEATAREIAAVATTHGIDRACFRWSPTDVYMAALLNALDSVHGNLQGGAAPQGHALQQAIAAGERAFGAGRGDGMSLRGGGPVQSRIPLTEQAKEKLEKWFLENVEDPFPTDREKMDLGQTCGMTQQNVNNWFGNKRMRIKRKLLNLPAGTDEDGVADAANISDKVLSPRAKWKAVVVSRLRTKAGREVILSAMGRARAYGEPHDVHPELRSREQSDGPLGYQ